MRRSCDSKQNPHSARRNNFPDEPISRWFLRLSEALSASNYPGAANYFRWVAFLPTLVRGFARMFLHQDKQAMERQALGLRSAPSMMLLGDADMPARWYYRLKKGR